MAVALFPVAFPVAPMGLMRPGLVAVSRLSSLTAVSVDNHGWRSIVIGRFGHDMSKN